MKSVSEEKEKEKEKKREKERKKKEADRFLNVSLFNVTQQNSTTNEID
jgi:predicted HTH domain antitoxin